MSKNAFAANIVNTYGSRGEQWLRDLPMLVHDISKRYELLQLTPVSNLSYNYVLSGFQAERPIILKLGLDNIALKREAAALKAFAGFKAAQVFAEEGGMLIIERALPGKSLKDYFRAKDEAALDIAALLMKELHMKPIPKKHDFPHIGDWLTALDKDWDIPEQYLQKARILRTQLLDTAAPDVLLHGDLHHDNILSNGDGWLVIDPKGVIGEPSFDALYSYAIPYLNY
jgi:streptomycin 6-kinase